jgi:hypothetical protein
MNEDAVVLIVLSELIAKDSACLHKVALAMGYTFEGIRKHTLAAKCHSIEARLHGGRVPNLRSGGVTASMQSTGATGRSKGHIGTLLLEGLAKAGFGKKRLKQAPKQMKQVQRALNE